MLNSKKGYKQPLIVDDFMYGSNVAKSYVTIRIRFLRKIYVILSAQLAFTTLVGIVLMCWTGLQETIKAKAWVVILNLVATIIIMIALMFKRSDYPNSYYLLATFTFFKSISIGLIASFHSTWVVIQSLSLTTLIVILLTLYTYQSKRNFSAIGAFLITSLLMLFFAGLFHVFFHNETAHTVLAVIGALVLSGFIVFDTHMIIKKLSPDEYTVNSIWTSLIINWRSWIRKRDKKPF